MRRLFIGIELPEKTVSKIADLMVDLSKAVAGRFVPKENLHITMSFLGDPALTDPELIRIVNDLPVEREIELNGLGAFPSMARPRVLFIRVKTDLSDFYAGLPKTEEERFVPHVTLCRLDQRLSESGKELLSETGFEDSFYSERLALFSSDFKTYRKLS